MYALQISLLCIAYFFGIHLFIIITLFYTLLFPLQEMYIMYSTRAMLIEKSVHN